MSYCGVWSRVDLDHSLWVLHFVFCILYFAFCILHPVCTASLQKSVKVEVVVVVVVVVVECLSMISLEI